MFALFDVVRVVGVVRRISYVRIVRRISCVRDVRVVRHVLKLYLVASWVEQLMSVAMEF